jgi:hypothetical protein
MERLKIHARVTNAIVNIIGTEWQNSKQAVSSEAQYSLFRVADALSYIAENGDGTGWELLLDYAKPMAEKHSKDLANWYNENKEKEAVKSENNIVPDEDNSEPEPERKVKTVPKSYTYKG